jgi:hypothetical protein
MKPFLNGRYEVSAGLRPRGDEPVFHWDEEFFRYRKAKELARLENLDKYDPPSFRFPDALAHKISLWMVQEFLRVYSEQFQYSVDSYTGLSYLDCKLTGDRIVWNQDGYLDFSQSHFDFAPKPKDLIDALAMQVQEDFAVFIRNRCGEQWLARVHLCFPNHWAAQEKIGLGFNAIHLPVAGFERLAKAAPTLVSQMVEKGPYVRFAWGVATDDRLNHHPVPPPGVSLEEWQGRQFSESDPKLFVRVERQTLQSFEHEDLDACFFTIRTYFHDTAKWDLDSPERKALYAAIAGMSTESLKYKGLFESRDKVLKYLQPTE